MKCPRCYSENRTKAKFCLDCGESLERRCPKCKCIQPFNAKYCDACGHDMGRCEVTGDSPPFSESERKQVTVLFSDLSAYTVMSEKLDPEEVKDIMSRIFGEIAQIVTKYEGFIERFVGDAVMAIFGVPIVQEDDPVRAIKVAIEIHDTIESISTQFEKRVGQKLTMHTGINTGLVVTGEVNLGNGTHGVTGDTINLAARLSSIATAGEILVGPETFRQAEGFFTFEPLQPTKVKGKAHPVKVYKVLSSKERPFKIHRLSGRKSVLIGRKAELAQLHQGVEQLRKGEGTVFAIYGGAGSGKSRLVEEFRATLDMKEVRWAEGHAYSYSKNMTYFPLIDLFNRAWQIEEADPPEKVKRKIEVNIDRLIGEEKEIKPYLGSLYALDYPEIANVNPELWKFRLKSAVQAILSALTKKTPMVLCFEDIHWADTSSVDLLRSLLLEFAGPALFLCVYRPPFTLFDHDQLIRIGKHFQEIKLQEFSLEEAREMIISLLETKQLPQGLLRFIWEKVEGNPFYLEEVMNSLIDSGTLIRENEGWCLARSLLDSDVPPTIQGVISARLDRLDKQMKRVLQEASVIGRAFLYEILRRITLSKDKIETYLSALEQTDLIRRRSVEPDLEYIFKHAFTHEVAYNGLLRKQRQEIHERIALVIEKLFKERIIEFYETLSHHFEKSGSVQKAIYYLMKSGEKSLNRYAVEESHKYFENAFHLLLRKPEKSAEDHALLIDLLIKWAFVFHYRGDFKGLKTLLSSYETLAVAAGDRERLGMYYSFLGLALYETGAVKDAYQCLSKALEIGEELDNRLIIGYASSWLSWVCTELGSMDKAIRFGENAQHISKEFESEDYLFFGPLSGMGVAYWYMGDKRKTFEAGKALLDYGKRNANIRSTVLGHFVTGCGYLVDGNTPLATECFQNAVKASADPWYCQFPKMLLAYSHVLDGKLQEAEDAIEDVLRYSRQYGTEIIRTPATSIMGIISIAKGHLSKGMKMLEVAQREHLANGRKYAFAIHEYLLGQIYMEISMGSGLRLNMVKEIRFIVKKFLFPSRKAQAHFNKSIEVAEEIGAKLVQGMAYLGLGTLLRKKRKIDQAKECAFKAIELFEKCEAEAYLKMANEMLESMN
jgi:class 3 adenylate cyclase/tetratricopeptide (TPR) repeat protein